MRSQFNRAFSLLEVLIAVGILSVAVITIFRSFTACLSAARFSQHISLASFLAEEKIFEIEQAYKNNLIIEDRGLIVLTSTNFNWHYEILDTQDEDLKELKFIVSWKENQREQEYPMEFLTYLPVKQQ